jgi:hypothetical protein
VRVPKIKAAKPSLHKMNVIQNKNATKLILNQNRVNQAVMNFEKGNIGVKDGTAIHRQGLYKLPDIVQKLRDDANPLLLALFFPLIHLLKVVFRLPFVCTFPLLWLSYFH